MKKRSTTATDRAATGTIPSARTLALLVLAACAGTAPMGASSPDLAGRRAVESPAGPGTGPAVLPEPRPASQAGRAGSISSRLTSGSAPSDAPVTESATVTRSAAAPAALPAPSASSAVGSPAPASCSALNGAHALKRSALLRVLDAGLGTWLGAVEVEPKIVRGRFEGWLLRSLHAGEACWAGVDLRPGDVISRVNHRPVEKPEQAHAVWSALRHAREISVDFVRGAEGHTLRFAIVDDS
jgi:hypothetical protein